MIEGRERETSYSWGFIHHNHWAHRTCESICWVRCMSGYTLIIIMSAREALKCACTVFVARQKSMECSKASCGMHYYQQQIRYPCSSSTYSGHIFQNNFIVPLRLLDMDFNSNFENSVKGLYRYTMFHISCPTSRKSTTN